MIRKGDTVQIKPQWQDRGFGVSRYLILLLAVALIDQLIAPRPGVATPPRPHHYTYRPCDLTVTRCIIA